MVLFENRIVALIKRKVKATLSRHEALKRTKGRSVERELQDQDVYPRWVGRKTIREEVPEAYKDVSLVVDVVQRAGLARKVARIRPMGVVKG